MFVKILCFISTVLVSTTLFGQRPKYIHLKAFPLLDISDRMFYVDSVIDNRANKANIGQVRLGLFSRLTPAELDGPFETALKSWFETTVPKKEGQVRLIAVINDLRIEEDLSTPVDFANAELIKPGSVEFGVANVDVMFCKLDSGKLKVVAETQNEQKSIALDATIRHRVRIDLALCECLRQLEHSRWQYANRGLLILRKP
jgi:hypothetical protein